jgi:prepilin-type N-terminal cleavage/methylation domain-containing protein
VRRPNQRLQSERTGAFTLIELMLVIAVIAILAALILGTSGYVQRKGNTSRAEAEIKALEAAAESYKADNGIYPRNGVTDALNARATTTATMNPDNYKPASFYLYTQLSGDLNGDRQLTSSEGKQYMAFKPGMLSPPGGTGTVTHIQDPFGYSYGYSTANQASPSDGFNPTFDLWSTTGTTSNAESGGGAKWIKNW